MALNIVISDRVRFKVKGSITMADGSPSPFDFWLTCRRMNSDQVKAAFNSEDESMATLLKGVIEDWSNVHENGAPVPYSPDAFDRLAQIPGVVLVAFRTYLAEVGAKEKN